MLLLEPGTRLYAMAVMLASNKILVITESLRLSPCILVQPDGWARGEREGYGEPCDVTSLSLRVVPSEARRPIPYATTS